MTETNKEVKGEELQQSEIPAQSECNGLLSQPFDYKKDLSCWFGLSYASFLTLPRVLMEAMPKEWQEKMAVLLNEFDEEFPYQPDVGTRVQITQNGKLIATPDWMKNYRHPDREALACIRR